MTVMGVIIKTVKTRVTADLVTSMAGRNVQEGAVLIHPLVDIALSLKKRLDVSTKLLLQTEGFGVRLAAYRTRSKN